MDHFINVFKIQLQYFSNPIQSYNEDIITFRIDRNGKIKKILTDFTYLL